MPFDVGAVEPVCDLSVDAHAAEVTVDDEGRRWVSHCGWGVDGVHPARLTWRPSRGADAQAATVAAAFARAIASSTQGSTG